MAKQKIRCDVHDCHYCNREENECKKEEIKVCHCNEGKEKEATMCSDYMKREANQ